MLGFGKDEKLDGEMNESELTDVRNQMKLSLEIFEILSSIFEIMDEVDVLLRPLKIELNWPLEVNDPLDFTRSKADNG